MHSIAGISASLTVKIKPEWYGLKEISETGEKDKSQEELLSEVLIEIKKLNSNISGDEDTTLLTQLQKLRTGLMDKQDELNKSFKEFAEKMIEDNSKSLVDALTEVMRDFNTRINDQLGDNFKQLNEGVGKMLEWQDNYKGQIEISIKQLESSEKSLKQTSESMSSLTKNSEKFKEIADSLKEELEVMENFISKMKILSDTLSGSGETISKEMKGITQKSLAELGEGLASISEKLASDYSKVQEAMTKIS